MKIRLKFIREERADGIEVIIKAKRRDEEVDKIIDLLGGETEDAFENKPLDDKFAFDINEVVIISKYGRYLSVKTTNGEFVLSEPLYKIEERLDQTRFVKISQSEIVNLDYVERWKFEGGGVIMVEMFGGIKTYTSRRYTSKIRTILKKGGKRS